MEELIIELIKEVEGDMTELFNSINEIYEQIEKIDKRKKGGKQAYKRMKFYLDWQSDDVLYIPHFVNDAKLNKLKSIFDKDLKQHKKAVFLNTECGFIYDIALNVSEYL